MSLDPVLVLNLLSCILLCHHHFIAVVNGGDTLAASYHKGDVAINCGSIGNSTALDGREWIGEATSTFMTSLQPKGKSRSSTADDKSFSVDPIPYMTSRISANPFHYTFQVNPGQKFIRLHFYPASYRGFEKSVDFFTVTAGLFTLLRDFSASVNADALGAKYLVKEFCLDVEGIEELKITFSPYQGSNIYAFVNGIEILAMPTGLYYTPPGDLGVRVVGQSYQLYIIDNTTALEMIQRLNVGGRSIAPVEDLGMFRRWGEDTNYLLESEVHRVNHLAFKIKYTNLPAFIAPPKLYQTSWRTRKNRRVSQMYNFTWKIPTEFGFAYIIRLHFCELDAGMTESGQRVFSILINNQIAETQADVIRWSGGPGIPVYRDYMVIMKAEKKGSKCDLSIALQSVNELVFGLLNGLEIFKLSNLKNNLANPNPTFPKRVSTSWILKIQKVFLGFGQSNVIAIGLTILIILASTIVYNLRRIWEEKLHQKKDTQVATTELTYRCFSLVEIMSATQNFSDAFVIGRGGFGKVYRGFIRGISVAIKRLNSNSKQGAHEFWTEIETLSKLRHIHLVSLIGYCNECQEMILLYEYMPCGTLADNLYKFGKKEKDCSPLTWKQRLGICIGAARGLEYLHTGTEYGVIHRDVKDSNIMLDEDFVAKISDFGLSKLERITESKSFVSTKVKGTFGYLDPDYFTTNRLTRKSDVYSFGVVLLVVLSGRPAVDTRTPEEPQSLLSCFRECIAKGDIDRIVDPRLLGQISSNSLREFVKSTENCLHHLPKKRPTMAQVVASLEQALEQQDSPMISASADTTVALQPFVERTTEALQISQCHEDPILEESIISPPREGMASKANENPASPTKAKDLQSREKDYATVRKPLWGWPWKTVWNMGKIMKRRDLVSPNSSSASTSIDEQPNKSSHCTSLVGQSNKPSPRFSLDELSNYGSRARLSFDKIQKVTPIDIDGHIIIYGGHRKAHIGYLKQQPAMTVRIYQYPIKRPVLNICLDIERLSQLRHSNLLSLIGYCYRDPDPDQIFLVYEHIGFSCTLHRYLYGSTNQLSWKRKLHICIGVAQGLDYLHKGTEHTFIHYEVRPENIVVDRCLSPKISNFGLFKLRPVGHLVNPKSIESAWLEYLSPEAMSSGLQPSEKSDVYSFGLVLLELLCSKKRKEFHLYLGEDQRYLKHWVKNNIKSKKFHQFIDPSVQKEIAATCLAEFLKIAFSCLLVREKKRPSMSDVTEKLKFALQLQEKTEERKQDLKGKGIDDGLNLEDIYQDISYLAHD